MEPHIDYPRLLIAAVFELIVVDERFCTHQSNYAADFTKNYPYFDS